MHPRSIAHVGVTVPDIEEAIEWYRDVLGWTLLTEPRTVDGTDGVGGPDNYEERRAKDVLGEFDQMTVATLVTGNQVGIELFEFTPSDGAAAVDQDRTGFFHLCVVDPDVEGLAETIDERGGNHHAEVWRLHEDLAEYKLTYCRDPYGNRIEIFSHNQEQMYNPIEEAPA